MQTTRLTSTSAQALNTTFNKNLSLVLVFSLLFLAQFSIALSQERPGLPPKIRQYFQNLQQKPGAVVRNENNNDISEWTDNFDPNLINSKKDFLQNLIPPFLRDSFKSAEEFEAFARETLLSAVSEDCGRHLKELFSQLLESLPNGHLPATWALQMVDAWGKFPSGILSGHTQIPGDFHECLQIRGNLSDQASKETASSFKGKYCSTYLIPATPTPAEPPAAESTHILPSKATGNGNGNGNGDGPKEFVGSNLPQAVSPEELIDNMLGANGVTTVLFPFIGTCFPSSCSVEDAQAIFTNFYNSSFTTSGALDQVVVDCYTDEKPPFDAGDISVIILLMVIIILCLAGSLFDILFYRRRSDTAKGSSTTVDKFFLAFSVPLNTEKFLSTNVGSDNLGCLHGLRFLSMAWVLLGHTWFMNLYQSTWNLIDLQNMYHDTSLLAVLNATVAVDTFFTIGGTLMSYNLLRELDRSRGKLNYPLMVLHRYLRLTPTYIILVAVIATLLPYFASGPQWYIIDASSAACARNWWYNALYINNFQRSPEEICYGESWYLANDMQFFLIAPLIVYPIWRWRKVGLGILGVFCTASIVIPALIQHVKKLPPQLIISINPSTFSEDLYKTPWCRIGPYLVGIFLGYVLYIKSNSPKTFPKLPLVGIVVGWSLSTATALVIIFGVQNFFDPANELWTTTSVAAAFYSGLNRFVWGGVIAWIIFACVSGYGGWVNRFLSWKVFMPLGRLTFCVYISSFHIQQLYHLTQTAPVHYSVYANVNYFCAHMVITCLVGYILTITLEAPFIQLEKLLIPSSKRSEPKPKAELPHTFVNNNNNGNGSN